MAIFELEFAEDVGDVEFDGALGDAQGFGDVLIGEATHEELKDLGFASGEEMAVEELGVEQGLGVRDERQENFGRDPQLAFQDIVEGVRKFILPGFVKFNEAINPPEKQADFFGERAAAGSEESKELAAGRVRAAAQSERAEINL